MLAFAQIMLHELFRTWFLWVEHWGYLGVFILMAMESSIIPVPSEIVMPPAAFWAAQGKMSFAGVVLAGTAGSYFGSLVSYWISLWVGGPIIQKYGKYFLFPPKKILMAEQWLSRYGVFGVFLARLLPVIRHLISIPAGVFRMNFTHFSVATLIGAGIWCTVLSWLGGQIIGNHPELLDSPEALMQVIRQKLSWFVILAIGFTFLFLITVLLKKKANSGLTQNQT